MSREEDILEAIINDESYDKTPQSRNEEILLSIINDTEYTKTPQSRIEELYLQLKEKIGPGPYPPIIKKVTGNPIVISDGADAPMVECKVTVEESQDLHGQDKPWTGGSREE